MKNHEVDEGKLDRGEYCQKRVTGCFCAVGWPPERQCPDCRRDQERGSFCVCPPPEEKPEIPQTEQAKEQIRKLLDSVKDADRHLDPHALAAAKEFGRLQVEYFLESRKHWEEFQDDMRTKVFKKNYGPTED